MCRTRINSADLEIFQCSFSLTVPLHSIREQATSPPVIGTLQKNHFPGNSGVQKQTYFFTAVEHTPLKTFCQKSKLLLCFFIWQENTKIDQWLGVTFSLMTVTALLLQWFFLGILFTSASIPLKTLGIQINCIALHFLAGTQCNEFLTSV